MSDRMILTAAALAALCAGCRSDGGIDRSDNASGLRFSTRCIAMQFRDDVANTKKTVADAPGALRRSIDQSNRDLTESYYLYLQNGQFR